MKLLKIIFYFIIWEKREEISGFQLKKKKKDYQNNNGTSLTINLVVGKGYNSH